MNVPYQEKEKSMNPSPRQIFQEIGNHDQKEQEWELLNARERVMFDKMMIWYCALGARKWADPMSDNTIATMRSSRPEYYDYLIKFGLVKRKMVQREWRNKGIINKDRVVPGKEVVPDGADFEIVCRWQEEEK